MNKHICIIDDDPICVYTTRIMMESMNSFQSISVFKNGKEAFNGLIELIREDKAPDFILLDINMPVWDAWDFLDEFKNIKLSNSPSVYVVSSSNDPEDEQRALSYPCVKGFLLKPIQPNQLIFDH